MKIFRASLIAGILLFALAVPVLGVAISHPDSAPSITNININRYLVASGDMCITGLYTIPYATLPTTIDSSWTADKAFLLRLISTDGVTELGQITPYVHFVSGYRQGVFSFYFSPTTAPTWGLAYIIRISENPALFAAPQSWDTTIPASSYTSFTSQADNQADLSDKVIARSHTLESVYSSTLLSTSGARIILSVPTGENYFRGVIYGLQAMAPSLYLVQSSSIDMTPTIWNTANFDAYAARFAGTWVGTAQNATATQFGLSDQLVMSIPMMLGCLVAVIFSSLLVRKVEPGWIIACVLLMMGALLGWVPMAIFAIIYQTMAVYLAWIWFGSKGKMMPFLTMLWFFSTLICLIIEGSYFGDTQNSIIHDLVILTKLDVGNIFSVAASSLTFFRGVVRVFLFDYSFYSGGFVIFRYFWVVVAGGAIVWDIIQGLSSIFAQFATRF